MKNSVNTNSILMVITGIYVGAKSSATIEKKH